MQLQCDNGGATLRLARSALAALGVLGVLGVLGAWTTNRAAFADDEPVREAPDAGAARAPTEPQQPRLDVPEPLVSPRATLLALGPSPGWYERPPPTGWGQLRLLIGPVLRRSARDVPGGSLTIDVVAGAKLGFGRWGDVAWAFVPEVGFSETSPFTRAPAHLVQAGVGFGHQNRGSSVGFVPRFVVGSADGARAMGGRAAVYGDVLTGNKSGFSVEASYEALRLDATATATSPSAVAHAVRLSFGIDLTLFFARPNCTWILYGSPERGCSR